MRSSRYLLSFVALTSLATGVARPALADELSSSPALETPTAPHGRSDHGRAVGHIGWAAFGTLSSVQLGSVVPPVAAGIPGVPPTAAVFSSTPVSTPAIGARWWLLHASSLDLGIDAGLGFVFGSNSTSATSTTGTTTSTTTTTVPGSSGLFLHVGVPLAMFPTEHAVLNIVPELDIGGAWANGGGTNRGGFLFDIGGRVGPEIHLGFFGVPQFSIQPSVSLFLNVNNAGATYSSGTGAGATTGNSAQTSVSFFTAGLGLAFFYYPTAN